MYPVSLEYQEKIKENNRLLEAKIQIQHSKGVLNLSDKDLVTGTLIYTEGSQAGEEFTIGSTVASDISFTILNKSEYDDINFMGSMVTCSIGLEVKEGIDAHFIQPSQPSKMKRYERKVEYVPLGRFNIDYDPRQRNTIELKAIDNMINLDKPYSLSKLSYPATLYQIYVDICNVADVNIGTTNFINKDYIVNKRPEGDLSLRDVLGYVAELTGSFARMNRNGALELKWYTPTGLILDPSNRFDFKPSDDLVQIKGIMATIEDTTYLSGSEDYAIDLTENPLLQGGHETVLPNIFNKVKDTVFTPYESSWQGNMAVQAGDIITQVDRDGKIYKTLVTNSTYKYRGASKLAAKGLPEISKGYKGSTNRKIAQIKRKIDVEVGDKLTTLEEQILASTELIANMLGGYAVQNEDAFYIADNKDLSKAMKVWKWGLGGFGYSENGIDGPYTTAITADGSIVAMLVAANIITANMVQTGILTSEGGSSWFNLDSGEINIKNQLKFSNGQLLLNSAEAIKTLPNGTSIKGGTTTIDNTKIRVNHGSTNEYSEMNALGFMRKWPYGQAKYLNDIWVGNYSLASFPSYTSPPPPIIINLPESFRGRGSDVDIFLSFSDIFIRGGMAQDIDFLSFITESSRTILRVIDKNFNSSPPTVTVDSYIDTYWVGRENDWRGEKRYSRAGFVIIIVGK